MKEDRLRYSKCPHCKRHGIPAMGKFGYKSTRPVVCLYCKKTFKARLWASTFLKIAVALVAGFVGNFLNRLGVSEVISWVYAIVAFCFLYYLAQYFAPMREYVKRFPIYPKDTGKKK